MTTHAPPDHPGGAFPPLPIVTDHDVVIVKQRDGRHIPAEVGARIDQVLAKLDWKRAARAP